MKKIIKIVIILLLTTGFLACDDYLTYAPSGSVLEEEAISTANDVQSALNGVYYTLGTYRFFGRNVVALGDFAADNTWMTGTTGHFEHIYKYTVSADEPNLSDIWEYGYQVIDRSTKLIKAGKILLNSENIKDYEKSDIKAAISQAYALKALSHFTLVNIFSLPYSDENKGKLGIVLVDEEPIAPFENVERKTIEATYTHILKNIGLAKENINLVNQEVFTFNESSLAALEARVKFYMKDWNGAISAAQTAISKSGGKLVMDSTTYVNMWFSISPTSEDIFTIGKTAADNLSANSLNTLYNAYGGRATSGLVNLFDGKDIRLGLFGTLSGGQVRALKFNGLPTSRATSNVPVFRLPEMYLIIAESKAHLEQIDDAIDALFEIAKRNRNLQKSDIPKVKDALLKFISVERRRELFQEGHRWFDLRRTGEIMTRIGGSSPITDWNASKFVYPIPASEVNASGLTQNDGWHTALP